MYDNYSIGALLVRYMAKRAAGTVVVSARDGRLILRWTWQGRRFQMRAKLDDTPLNRAVCDRTAAQIQIDISSGQFDPTLKKYRETSHQSSGLTASMVLAEYAASKSQLVAAKSLERYSHVEKKLYRFAPHKLAETYTEQTAILFRDFLLGEVRPITTETYLIVVNAAWNWAISKALVRDNPWTPILRAFKLPPKQAPQPFTIEEVKAIIAAFEGSKHYRRYAPMVRFLFGVGCRSGEAIGLRWGVIYDDCSRIWMGESYKRGSKRGATKMHKARTIYPSETVQAILKSIRPDNPGPDDLVFPAPRSGSYINDNKFAAAVWRKCLQSAGVPHRKFYNTRSTFISHALANGASPAKVAEIVGDKVETIYRNYVGNPDGSKTVPDIGI